MKRFDRILGILLVLSDGQAVPAADLAGRFGVSRRTIYRDVQALAELGVPVYAQRGWEGGLRLMEGYFLPPLMFSTGEAISLVLGLAFMGSLAARPFAPELDTAERKLLAAMPARLRASLSRARALVGFEPGAADAFHPEPPAGDEAGGSAERQSGRAASTFLQALLDQRAVHMRYRSPYQAESGSLRVAPLGMLWDRERWYLAGRRLPAGEEVRLWRADRVLEIAPGPALASSGDFDVRRLLGRSWLGPAMRSWMADAPVQIRLTAQQADNLRQDWYYRHAAFDAQPDGRVLMTYGEDKRELVLALLRWLGPGAELIAPAAWRADLRAELARMLSDHAPVESHLQ